jgi:ADP-ribose pyrophosphatase
MIQEYIDFGKRHPELFNNEQAMLKLEMDPNAIAAWRDIKRKELSEKNLPLEWADIGIILNDRYILILRDLVEFPDGRKGSYFRVLNQADLRGGQGAVVLPAMNGKYLLLRQYRHPTRSWSYEVPRGFGEPGVPAEQQAENEVSEETQGEIAELIDLGIYHSNTGLEGNKAKLFYANLKSIGKPAQAEGIESYRWVSLSELEEMIATAKITDGFTIAAYTRAKLRGILV